jgi:hypothetical protein
MSSNTAQRGRIRAHRGYASQSPAISDDGNSIERIEAIITEQTMQITAQISQLTASIDNLVQCLSSQQPSTLSAPAPALASQTRETTAEIVETIDLTDHTPNTRSTPDQAILPSIRPKDIGYLDPCLDKAPVATDSNTIVFGDVNPFCEQLRRRVRRYNV